MVNLDTPCRKCGAIDRSKTDGRCLACARENRKIYYQNNRQKCVDLTRIYRLKNKESLKIYWESYNKKNPTRWKEYYAKNKQTALLKKREYAKNNPEKMREIWVRDKARRRANDVRPSIGIIEKLKTSQRGLCACCGKELLNKYHLDHILPIALGGTSEDSNLQLLLPECNIKKGAKHPVEYMQSIGKLL